MTLRRPGSVDVGPADSTGTRSPRGATPRNGRMVRSHRGLPHRRRDCARIGISSGAPEEQVQGVRTRLGVSPGEIHRAKRGIRRKKERCRDDQSARVRAAVQTLVHVPRLQRSAPVQTVGEGGNAVEPVPVDHTPDRERFSDVPADLVTRQIEQATQTIDIVKRQTSRKGLAAAQADEKLVVAIAEGVRRIEIGPDVLTVCTERRKRAQEARK